MPRWIDPTPPPVGIPALHEDPLLHAVLAARGLDIDGARALLNTNPPGIDPFDVPGMRAAADRVARAIATREPVAIYGDYDVDGVSATALLVWALRAATDGRAPLIARLPVRADGYGLNPSAVEGLAATGASLLIAVDCASTDHVNVALARSRGLDVVVLDHHQMDCPAPDGALVVSAQTRPDAPGRELTAAGLAYLLAIALATHGFDVGDGPGEKPTGLLDLAALGTIGDVAPLTGVNRALVRGGLRRIAERPRVGLRALSQRCGVGWTTLTSEQVAFKLTPRLNAAGRMADPRLALDLLLTDDPREAARLAMDLERLNAQRRVESERVVAEAEGLVRSQPDLEDRRLLVLARPGWGSGVLGLAAGRLAEQFGRPVVVLNDDGEVSRGSARSVPGFDITRALAGCADLIHAHGGHSQAAGLTVASANLPRLAAALEAALEAASLPPPGPPALPIDADLPTNRLALRTAEVLEELQPFGAGNPRPLLRLRDIPVRSYSTIGQDGSHLKVFLDTPRGVVQAICWGAAARSRELLGQRRIDLVVTLGRDYWNGQRRLQVEVKDFRPAEQSAVGSR